MRNEKPLSPLGPHLPPLRFQSSEAVAGATPSRSPGPSQTVSGCRPGLLTISISLLSVFSLAKPSPVPLPVGVQVPATHIPVPGVDMIEDMDTNEKGPGKSKRK
ncbi:hypothetical protein MRB53_020127 [Persea americana]|uniref:Uncharacterized protein n=1 Tax=Persea americana TaxID=3435 RepID=A0ACC2L049_PERAE|nr:hypothetical protein MRB53_020127 [Persea americana]